MTFPNVVIAGAPKSGTTSLFQWLAAHPAVVTSKDKETYYLIDPGYPLFKEDSNYSSGGLSEYSRVFPDYPKGQLCIEATPDYMYQQTALKVLSELPSRPKIIFILRNPVDRVLSLYRFARNNIGSLEHGISVSEFISSVKNGLLSKDQILNNALLHSEYHVWLEKWIRACGKSRIEVLFFEDMTNSPFPFMEGLCNLTGIDSDFYKDFYFKPANQSHQIRSTKMLRIRNVIGRALPILNRFYFIKAIYRMINVSPAMRSQPSDAAAINELYEYFVEPNRKLSSLLDKELPRVWTKQI